ncbi:uncharacterized protein DSM5745_07750 [Aspergillus mulundensis]|uniref:Copper acquisition factor BIM1-like domain-containing protein n=1 Tax=Aspergillus mulundensis TaxID=1810919 RepID=A0A3D8RF59_9EURO|nr:hypothetical protein DSM5745_07750 [Aspergillus mulundensis]RDW72578.1 hypothetical protein DSM5745_07750 [Aspergillus mulundensis]
MKHSIVALGLLPLTTAHFSLTYPTPRGTDTKTMAQFPCGGLSPSPNRTQISLDSPSFPVALDMGHDQTAVQILLGLGSAPGPNYNVTLRKTFRVEGLGGFCIPDVELSEDVLGARLVDGLEVTLQVVSNGHPSGGLYACADLQLVSGSVPGPSDSVCANNTGITAVAFTGAAADRNANASTADGEAQSGDSGHEHGNGNSTGSDNETATADADSPTSTDAASAIQTAAWGVLGAVVVGGLAVLPKGAADMSPMATTADKFERLRAVGLSEKYSTTRHPLRFYINVAITARYTIPESFTLPLQDYVYKAVETLINQHPILSAIPIGEETNEPYWARLPEIDLTQPVSFRTTAKNLTLDEHDSELQSLIEAQHEIGFTAPEPYWRLLILTDGESEKRFIAVFMFHHALGDGTSGKAFHRTFLRALRGTASLKPGEAKQVVIPPKTALLPPLEDVHPLPISIPYLLKVVYKTWFASKPDPSLWAGGPFQLPLKTHVRVLVLSRAQTSALVKVCHEHGTTVTCAVETAIARSIFPHIPERYTRVQGSIPITQRSWLPDTITDESMGVYVQEMPETFYRQAVTGEGFPWDEAQRAKRTITKELALKSKNTAVGLFKYVKDYRKELCESKIGKPRPATFEVSSLGVVKTETAEDVSVPQMGRVIFTQSASVTGAAIQFSLITGADGCLALGASWQPGVVEEDTVQAVMDSVKRELHQLSGLSG